MFCNNKIMNMENIQDIGAIIKINATLCCVYFLWWYNRDMEMFMIESRRGLL